AVPDGKAPRWDYRSRFKAATHKSSHWAVGSPRGPTAASVTHVTSTSAGRGYASGWESSASRPADVNAFPPAAPRAIEPRPTPSMTFRSAPPPAKHRTARTRRHRRRPHRRCRSRHRDGHRVGLGTHLRNGSRGRGRMREHVRLNGGGRRRSHGRGGSRRPLRLDGGGGAKSGGVYAVRGVGLLAERRRWRVGSVVRRGGRYPRWARYTRRGRAAGPAHASDHEERRDWKGLAGSPASLQESTGGGRRGHRIARTSAAGVPGILGGDRLR